MSFRCEFCGFPQDTGVSPERVVTKIRSRGGVGAFEAVGNEIAEEKNACKSCSETVETEMLSPEPVLDAVGDPSFV